MLLARGTTTATLLAQWRKRAIRIVGKEEMQQPARDCTLKPPPDPDVTRMVDDEPAEEIALDDSEAPAAEAEAEKPKKRAKKKKKKTAKKKAKRKTAKKKTE